MGDPLVKEMQCPNCLSNFCYDHGGAHEGKTCAEHVEANADGACIRLYEFVDPRASWFWGERVLNIDEIFFNSHTSASIQPVVMRNHVYHNITY